MYLRKPNVLKRLYIYFGYIHILQSFLLSSSSSWGKSGGGQIYPTLTAISPTPILHLARFMASSFSKPTLLLSFSTCIFYNVFFWSTPLLLVLHFKLQRFLQNMSIIPPQHMPAPSHSIRI